MRSGGPARATDRPVHLVIDASVCLEVCLSASGWDLLAGHELIAPPLLRSEVQSTLRSLDWRRAVSPELVQAGRQRLRQAPVQLTTADDHLERAWAIAARLGWARTYDAEYIAVAQAHDVALLTIDERLQRGATGIVTIVTPTEL
jgi:predicted nucleic acid-binding protein